MHDPQTRTHLFDDYWEESSYVDFTPPAQSWRCAVNPDRVAWLLEFVAADTDVSDPDRRLWTRDGVRLGSEDLAVIEAITGEEYDAVMSLAAVEAEIVEGSLTALRNYVGVIDEFMRQNPALTSRGQALRAMPGHWRDQASAALRGASS